MCCFSIRGIDAKTLLGSLASSLMSRGFVAAENGASQVVALNLTNLFVLVLLKALIFAAGSLGAGAWKGGFGRSSDGEEKFLTDEEILLFVSYLSGICKFILNVNKLIIMVFLGTPGNNSCLKQVACQDPREAQKYVMAGSTLLKVSKMLELQPDGSYEIALKELEDAASSGLSGDNCQQYKCRLKENTTGN